MGETKIGRRGDQTEKWPQRGAKRHEEEDDLILTNLKLKTAAGVEV
jgi:hypothetical protein